MTDKELQDQLKEAKNKTLEALSSVEEALPLHDMDNQVINTIDRSRTSWTPPMDRYFIDLMLDQARIGQKSEKSFTKHAWAQITFSFNKKFDMQLDKEVLKNRNKKLKTQYMMMRALIAQNGFKWDDSRQMMVADDESIWDDYVKAHPEAKSMRTKTMPNYYKLHEIFANTSASDNFSHASKDINRNDLQAPQSTAMINHGDELVPIEDDSSPSDAEQETPNRKRKQKKMVSSISRQPKKVRKSTCELLADAVTALATVVSSLVDKEKDNSSKSIDAVEALDAISDLDDDLYLDACDLLEDDRKLKIFGALDVSKRKKWLLRKLRPCSIE